MYFLWRDSNSYFFSFFLYPLKAVVMTSPQSLAIPINWKLCVICQLATSEPLQCPANSKRSDKGAGYKSFSESVKSFQDLGEIPLGFDPNKIDDGSGIEKSLIEYKASWHKSCRNKFNATELKRALKRKASDFKEKNPEDSPCKTRRSSVHSRQSDSEPLRCFFCDRIDDISNLHCASTKVLDKRVKQCAVQLKDTNLLAKLAAAIDAKYHSRCLASLYNRCRTNSDDDNANESQQQRRLHGIAFGAIVSYIEELFEDKETNCVPSLKLADIGKMYKEKLKDLGADAGQVNTTRLKDRILSTLPQISAHSQGRDILLVLDQDVGDAIKLANELDTLKLYILLELHE